jgi:hypothetical protein
MADTEFKLATYAGNPGGRFAAIVLGDTAIDIDVPPIAIRRAAKPGRSQRPTVFSG